MNSNDALVEDWLRKKPRRESFRDDAEHSAAVEVWRDKLQRALAACGYKTLRDFMPDNGRISSRDWRA